MDGIGGKTPEQLYDGLEWIYGSTAVPAGATAGTPG